MGRLTFIISALILLGGCTNFLNVHPQGKVIPQTDEEFAAIMHNRIKDIEGGGDEYVLGNMETIVRLEGCADNLDANIRTGTNLPAYAGEIINRRQRYYEHVWEIVRDCNIVIENMEGRTGETAAGTLAAASAMKGICYYNLIRDFCDPWIDGESDRQLGVPIVDRFDINDMPARSSLKASADYALGLFDKALSQGNTDALYFFTEYIIKAYKAKLLFWTEDWEKTRDLCKDIMEHSGLALTPIDGYAAMINAPTERKGEVLVRSHINNSSELDWYFSAIKTYLSSRPVGASLIRLFGDDPSKDVRFASSFNKKRSNVKVPECKVRLSEIVLMLAEAHYHLGEAPEALEWLNTLRSNRIEGVTDYTQTNLPGVRADDRIKVDALGQNLTPLLQAIFDERRKELYMEGDRWFELKRNGRPEWWVVSNGLKYTTKAYLYTAPISKKDIEMNKDMVQNPGYEF